MWHPSWCTLQTCMDKEIDVCKKLINGIILNILKLTQNGILHYIPNYVMKINKFIFVSFTLEIQEVVGWILKYSIQVIWYIMAI